MIENEKIIENKFVCRGFMEHNRKEEEEQPVLAQALACPRSRRLALAIEAELCALVSKARSRPLAGRGKADNDNKEDEEEEEEEEEGRQPRQLALVLALSGYGRLLVHKTVQRFEGLKSFSIGVGSERRTLILAHPATARWCAAVVPFLFFSSLSLSCNSHQVDMELIRWAV